MNMKLRLNRNTKITKETKIAFIRKVFGFTLFCLITSGFKFNLLACIFVGILFSGYIFISDAVFDLLMKFGSFIYDRYLKDRVNGIREAKKKIQGV